eukprot:1092575-Rhodomonas_salina.2
MHILGPYHREPHRRDTRAPTHSATACRPNYPHSRPCTLKTPTRALNSQLEPENSQLGIGVVPARACARRSAWARPLPAAVPAYPISVPEIA